MPSGPGTYKKPGRPPNQSPGRPKPPGDPKRKLPKKKK